MLLAHPKQQALFRAGIVPQIVVLDAEGLVTFARTGTLIDGPALDSVMHAVQNLRRTATSLTGGSYANRP